MIKGLFYFFICDVLLFMRVWMSDFFPPSPPHLASPPPSMLFLWHTQRDIPTSNKVEMLFVEFYSFGSEHILLLGLETRNHGPEESNAPCHFRGETDVHKATWFAQGHRAIKEVQNFTEVSFLQTWALLRLRPLFVLSSPQAAWPLWTAQREEMNRVF